MSISFDLTSVSTNKVALLFDEFPNEARAELTETLRSITAELEAMVKAAEPSRTGALREATVAYVNVETDKISGHVKISGPSGSQIFAKAGALEYGAHKPGRVRSHRREVTTIFGHLVEPTQQIVEAFTRTPNIAAHDFLRGPLAAKEASIISELQAALDKAVARANA